MHTFGVFISFLLAVQNLQSPSYRSKLYSERFIFLFDQIDILYHQEWESNLINFESHQNLNGNLYFWYDSSIQVVKINKKFHITYVKKCFVLYQSYSAFSKHTYRTELDTETKLCVYS